MRFVPDETGVDKTALRKAGSGRNAAGRNGANRLFPASGSGWILLRTAQDRPSQAYGFGEETFLSEGAAFPKNEGAGRGGMFGRIRRVGCPEREESPESPEGPECPEGCRSGLAFGPLGRAASIAFSSDRMRCRGRFSPGRGRTLLLEKDRAQRFSLREGDKPQDENRKGICVSPRMRGTIVRGLRNCLSNFHFSEREGKKFPAPDRKGESGAGFGSA